MPHHICLGQTQAQIATGHTCYVEAKMEYSELTFVSMTLVVSHRKVTRGKEIQSPYKVITQKQ